MKISIALALLIGFAIATPVNAQAPAGTTGVCKDGTYTSAATKRGACAGHGGVKEWSAEKAEATPAATPAPSPPMQSPKAQTTTPPATTGKPTTTAASAMPAAGGGPGQVWVNTSTKVYHCMGDKWYGKTKHGEYMTEAAAKAAGNHADHGKECSKS